MNSPLTESNKLLLGKVAFVTGAARGIGRAIAVDYARHGADVALLDLADPCGGMAISGYRLANEQELDEAVKAVEAEGVKALKLKVDIRDCTAMQTAVEQTVKELDRLDIVVANAGICIWTTIEAASEQQWRDVIDVNINGLFNTLKATVPHLKANSSGRIITVSSVVGRQGAFGNSAYSASKWGIIGITKSMAQELGSANITVNAIAPGPVETPMYRSQGVLDSLGLNSFEDQDKLFAQLMPLKTGSITSPQNIADTATFLASDRAKCISGEVIDVALGYNAAYTG